jgi:hypothetical protein
MTEANEPERTFMPVSIETPVWKRAQAIFQIGGHRSASALVNKAVLREVERLERKLRAQSN